MNSKMKLLPPCTTNKKLFTKIKLANVKIISKTFFDTGYDIPTSSKPTLCGPQARMACNDIFWT
jgi:hypothetical protein